MGDDLSLYGRFKRIVAAGGVPQYYVGGNHDLDFDATDDAHSFDTFRREWGPEYYSFDIGRVHFVVLDNVRYPCNGVDEHAFCDPARNPTYNGVIHERQLAWLRNDLAHVPQDTLGTGPAAFHQIVTGAVSGSWWAGDLDDAGIPHATQRLGSPRGYYVLDFDGADYVDTCVRFGGSAGEQFHASFNTPRFRRWAADLFAYVDLYGAPSAIPPPVTINDLGDMNLLTRADLRGGTWVAVNVWNGSRRSTVSVAIDGGAPVGAVRTEPGNGERARSGPEYADPWAVARQSTNGRMAVRSDRGGDDTAGFTTWRGVRWSGVAGPFPAGMLTKRSSHLWRADLPADLAAGVHTLEVSTTDRYGRTFRASSTFEVVETIPEMGWNGGF